MRGKGQPLQCDLVAPKSTESWFDACRFFLKWRIFVYFWDMTKDDFFLGIFYFLQFKLSISNIWKNFCYFGENSLTKI